MGKGSREETGEGHRVKIVKGLEGYVMELKLEPEPNGESLKGFKESDEMSRFAF